MRGGGCLVDVRGTPGTGEIEAGLEGLDGGGFLYELVLCGQFRYALLVSREANVNQ